MAKLFRGVSRELDRRNGGRLCSRGHQAAVVMRYGDWIHGVKHDGKFNYGPSENNAVRAHQLKTGLNGECYVSFSRSLEVAIRFATLDGAVSGFVYVIDEDLLAARRDREGVSGSAVPGRDRGFAASGRQWGSSDEDHRGQARMPAADGASIARGGKTAYRAR